MGQKLRSFIPIDAPETRKCEASIYINGLSEFCTAPLTRALVSVFPCIWKPKQRP